MKTLYECEICGLQDERRKFIKEHEAMGPDLSKLEFKIGQKARVTCLEVYHKPFIGTITKLEFSRYDHKLFLHISKPR